MAYKIVFRGTYGNTTVEVEDLARTGQACAAKGCRAKNHCGDYPGECQHCGKVHIRYLAHVDQDIANTLIRATDPSREDALVRSDEEVAMLGIQAIEGHCAARMDVGCVCVGKYLKDCGVDAGLAERFDKAIGRVTHLLQQRAAIEACMTDDRIARAIERLSIVQALRERWLVASKHPTDRDPETTNRWWGVRTKAHQEYEEARKRWERETHGYSTLYATSVSQPASGCCRDMSVRLRSHYEAKLHAIEFKLNRNAGMTYVA